MPAFIADLTLNLLTATIVAPPSNASKWQIGFNSAFRGLNQFNVNCCVMPLGDCAILQKLSKMKSFFTPGLKNDKFSETMLSLKIIDLLEVQS